MLDLRGVIPPIATPFDGDGKLDEPSLVRLTRHLLDGGVHGLFVLGSTGEGPALSEEERRRVVQVVVETVGGRVPVLAGITETSTHRAIALGQEVARLGADAVVLAPSFYHLPSQQELIDHFRAVHAAVPLPLVAYNVPSLVKAELTPETVELLAREGTIIALKDSSGDMSTFRQCILRTLDLPGFRLLTGMEFLVDVAVQMGAHGCVPGIGNVAPREYVQVYELACQGRWAEARAVQERLVALFDLCYQGEPGMSGSAAALSGFKSALRWLGVIETARMAPPLSTLPPEAEERVREVLIRTGFLAEA